MPFKFLFCLLFALSIATSGQSLVRVGLGQHEITPPVGTPSAGYAERQGCGMLGTHDPLLALAMLIDNGEKTIVFCSVDHLGFDYGMVQEVIQRIHETPELRGCEIYISSTHTHSGGGAFLDIPGIGEFLAGKFNPAVREFYIDGAVKAIQKAGLEKREAKIGFGYGKVNNVSVYRSLWPLNVTPPDELAVIKIVQLDGTPLAVLFNYAVHPTVLSSQNLYFSADFVGYAREALKEMIDEELTAIYFNGAQGDLNPLKVSDKDEYAQCADLGTHLATVVANLWHRIDVDEDISIQVKKEPYTFKVVATPDGFKAPMEYYQTEMNLIVFNQKHPFLTIPGELSCLYDHQLKRRGKELGYEQVSILGLTNDAHGYIILPESWEHATRESKLSFGGPFYGELVRDKAIDLILID